MSGYIIRICDVFGTPWRVPHETMPKNNRDFTLTSTFREFYGHQEGLPSLLAQLHYRSGDNLSVVSQRRSEGRDGARTDSASEGPGKPAEGSDRTFGDLTWVEVVLFALPIPVSQVVAALVVDLPEAVVSNDEDSRIRRLRDAMLRDEIRIDGRTVSEIVDKLARAAGAEHAEFDANGNPWRAPSVEKATRRRSRRRKGLAEQGVLRDGNELRLEEERHLLIFVHPVDISEPMPDDLDQQARALIYGAHWPYMPEFATITPPEDLNDGRRYAAVSHHASVLYGQSGEVDSSVLLITAQTVGTAARFQLIWRRASQKVADFQRDKQKKEIGTQSRESLAPLADEMGNLELDLTFNVQTAADLGLGSTTAFVDSFHRCLHDAMKFKTRANTVAEMFERVNSSIQSELTAIVSREREIEERRRVRGGAVIGVLSFLLAPATVIFSYFGVNTADVGKEDRMFNFKHFWGVYAFAGVLMVVAMAAAYLLIRGSRPQTELEKLMARRSRKERIELDKNAGSSDVVRRHNATSGA